MDVQQLKPLVLLNGTAKDGSSAPSAGLIDIGESQAGYVFRIALPGARQDASKVKCTVQGDGKVEVQGIVASGEILKKHPGIFQTRVDQQNPLGPFTISFNLPGPVDPRLFAPSFRPDGILEAVVLKQTVRVNLPLHKKDEKCNFGYNILGYKTRKTFCRILHLLSDVSLTVFLGNILRVSLLMLDPFKNVDFISTMRIEYSFFPFTMDREGKTEKMKGKVQGCPCRRHGPTKVKVLQDIFGPITQQLCIIFAKNESTAGDYKSLLLTKKLNVKPLRQRRLLGLLVLTLPLM
ncbi:hypothetical protein ACFE04_020106 [Oxalis oulophora]